MRGQLFFALLRAGLWAEPNGNLNHDVDFDGVDWGEVYQLAEEQSVTGLIADGIDRFKIQDPSFKCPQEWALQFIGSALQLEQQNADMNSFIAKLVDEMRKVGIYALLLKGQGVAQCYERPLWRANGDVDFFLSDDNYKKAKDYLLPRASSIEPEGKYEKHLGMTIKEWIVELHGKLRCCLSSKVDKVLDEIQKDTFYGGNVKSWNNNGTQIFLLGIENNVFYVFTHFLSHFYKGGIGLRQICDWCRLLWTYRYSLNYGLLESRIKKAGLVSEWRAFYALATKYLGMPDIGSQDSQTRMSDHRPSAGLMVHDSRFDKKADKIMDFILMSGNFGHNRDMSYYDKYPYVARKLCSLKMRLSDLISHARIFPLDSIRFSFGIMLNGLRSAVRGE